MSDLPRKNCWTIAYTYAGPMTYRAHEGEQPMRIIWDLSYALPADIFHYAKATAG